MTTTDLNDRLDAIRRAPEGPSIAAYFDYDGTVIDGYSASAFYRRRVLDREIGLPELVRTVLAGLKGIETGEEFEQFLELTLLSWKGRPADELMALGQKLFTDDIAGRLHGEVWDLVQAHRERGHLVLLASSATRFQVEPMGVELGADAVLCTELEVADGLITGRVEGHSLWGSGKADAVRAHAREHGINTAESFAYSNGDEDIPLLESMGNQLAVSPTPALRRSATERGWPILDCIPRPGMIPKIGDIARTAGFYGGMVGSLGAALGVGLLNRSRRQALDLTCSIGADVGFGLAGISMNIQGEEYLHSSRPCVFVFNHQSKLDIPIMMKLLRGGFTGVAKKEAANIPLWGQFFRFGEVAFIDRGNSAQARAALEPAVKRLKEDGISLALSPEGTRSATPRLGPFKKGAFHIAMQAGVPMVPIVIRNAGEVMSRGAQTLQAGTVDVCVLPPVNTSKWTVDTIDDHVEDVRNRFVDTLSHWPDRWSV